MTKALLTADIAVQAILLTPTLLFGIAIFPLILMIPLGIWQLSSALIKGLALGSRLHLTYFGAASSYVLALWACSAEWVEISLNNNSLQDIWAYDVWCLLFVIIIPLVGAIKYLKISYDDLEAV